MGVVARAMLAATALALASGPVAVAQAPSKVSNTFSGVKLVDLNARKVEQTVTLSLQADALKILDPASKQEVATIPYASITSVTHSVSSAPPTAAGDPSGAATQPVAPPMYMGKTPRNWLTIAAGGNTTVLRVSERVYAQLKDSLAAHKVEVQEAK